MENRVRGDPKGSKKSAQLQEVIRAALEAIMIMIPCVLVVMVMLQATDL